LALMDRLGLQPRRKSKTRADKHAATGAALSLKAIAGARNRVAFSSMPECEALSLAGESSDRLAAGAICPLGHLQV
jgi:hypothetical protein